jgi:hypothetical protein
VAWVDVHRVPNLLADHTPVVATGHLWKVSESDLVGVSHGVTATTRLQASDTGYLFQ